MIDIPTLTTDRLFFRALHERDLDAYAGMMADPEVTRFLGDGQPLTRVDAWRQMAMLLGHWQLRGFGLWAVEERATGAFVGRIGCFEPEGWPEFEVGYVLARHAWGKGYAREGAAAALAYARETLGRRTVVSVIFDGNERSVGVATSFGATRDGSATLFGRRAHIYRYPPPRPR